MAFEIVLLAMLAIGGIFLIGVPLIKFIRVALPRKRNALVEAKERLEQARLEAEAARLNKEIEKIYDDMYEEVLQDDNVIEQNRRKK